MNKDQLKLNIGCGLTAPDDWVNLDSSWNARLAKWPRIRKLLGKVNLLPKDLVEISWPQNIKILDVRKGLPYPDNSVKYIYLSHMLEHFTREDAFKLFGECRRVLIPSGAIRVIVPDLLFCVTKYLEDLPKWNNDSGQLPPSEKFLENLQIYDKQASIQPVYIKIYKKIYNKNIHKWMYDIHSLTYLLRKSGFKDITQRDYLESAIPDVEKLDRPERFQGSICLEAVK